ncbi:hypothetical protein H6F50_06760 [Coleofasciculus sp. FACHB-712]|uniref:hypothetical protein n=1 Tax=Cyanophyceae TaxID=3028117 RepID=UPI0016853B38|nr:MULTISPECIES: hypothetical protein [unclassified Coleofasciculus]MBD1892076.1 hypothetical protein [Coleofasciculus sp. FACHB-SPT9]MBD1942061.1 hypothetical protein [Coleofasciculus sp. FACHB-712]
MYSNLASDRSKRYRFATTPSGVHSISLNTEYKRSPSLSQQTRSLSLRRTAKQYTPKRVETRLIASLQEFYLFTLRT